MRLAPRLVEICYPGSLLLLRQGFFVGGGAVHVQPLGTIRFSSPAARLVECAPALQALDLYESTPDSFRRHV